MVGSVGYCADCTAVALQSPCQLKGSARSPGFPVVFMLPVVFVLPVVFMLPTWWLRQQYSEKGRSARMQEAVHYYKLQYTDISRSTLMQVTDQQCRPHCAARVCLGPF